jgi:streptogramin lyase
MQLPQFPTTQQLQADPTAPLPSAGGFVNIPLASFPQSPLLQTGMFAVPQTTTPQSLVATEDHVWFEDRWMVASLCDE